MNKDTFQGKWHEMKGKIKEKWGKLTDDDITQIDGRREKLLGTLQKKYGYAKEIAEKELKSWEEKCGCNSECTMTSKGSKKSEKGNY